MLALNSTRELSCSPIVFVNRFILSQEIATTLKICRAKVSFKSYQLLYIFKIQYNPDSFVNFFTECIERYFINELKIQFDRGNGFIGACY